MGKQTQSEYEVLYDVADRIRRTVKFVHNTYKKPLKVELDFSGYIISLSFSFNEAILPTDEALLAEIISKICQSFADSYSSADVSSLLKWSSYRLDVEDLTIQNKSVDGKESYYYWLVVGGHWKAIGTEGDY